MLNGRLLTIFALWAWLSGIMLAADISHVRQITIESSHMSLDIEQMRPVVIVNKRGKFKAGRKRIVDTLVSQLIEAIDEPAKLTVDPKDLGVTQEWLNSHAQSAAESAFWWGSQRQKDLFIQKFTDPNSASAAALSLFRSYRNDDYPMVRVTIVFDTGETCLMVSRSYYPFMIPWEVTNERQSPKRTHNAKISRAIAALMPRKSTNRSRLAGEDLEERLVHVIATDVRRDN